MNIGDVDLSQDDLARKIQKLADDRAEVTELIEHLQVEVIFFAVIMYIRKPLFYLIYKQNFIFKLKIKR